jgi:hypothetical protein
MQANELALQAGAQQRRIMAYAYGLERNDMTAGAGVRLLNQSKVLEPGVVIDRFEVGETQGVGPDGKAALVPAIIGVDANGQPVNTLNGQPFVIPIEQAEALYAEEFGGKTDETVVLPRGSQLANKQTGEVLASNDVPDPVSPADRAATRSEELSAVKYVRDGIANALGIDLTDTGRMMEGVDPAARDEAIRLTAIAGRLVRSGVDPEVAVNEAMKQRRDKQPATAGRVTPRYEGEVAWRK